MKILILGTTGMLGSTLFKYLSINKLNVWGTARNIELIKYFNPVEQDNIITGIDVVNQDSLVYVLNKIKPNLVINCVGIIKQQGSAKDPLYVLPINAMLPHRLSDLCEMIDARMIHISTDCVFNGKKGMYVENDVSDAEDLYGKSKYIGEIHNRNHVITIRTSIIGHELNSRYSLIDWFLSETNKVSGFKKAIFSGLPTIELARIIKDYIITNPHMSGLYHISADPINKYDLLQIVKDKYQKEIDIMENDQLVIDRSLNSEKFRKETGYIPPKWQTLIQQMLDFRLNSTESNHV